MLQNQSIPNPAGLAEQGQSEQSKQTMGTASCLFETTQLKLKDTSRWFVEDLGKFLYKTISGIFEVAEAGADFRHRAPSSFRVRGTLCQNFQSLTGVHT